MYDSSKPPRTRRDAQAIQTRERLIDAALAVFGEKGVAGATVKEIAAGAKVAPGLLYHYFADKEALLKAVFDRHGFVPQLRELLTALPDGPAEEVLRETALRFAALLAERTLFVQTLMAEARKNPQVGRAWAATIEEGLALLGRYLDGRVAAGELRPHRTDVTARTLMYTVIMLHLTQVPAEETVPVLVENLLAGLRPR